MAAASQRFVLQNWQAGPQYDENASPSPREKRSDAMSALIFHMIDRRPARRCIGVSGLARGALVEIDMIARRNG